MWIWLNLWKKLFLFFSLFFFQLIGTIAISAFLEVEFWVPWKFLYFSSVNCSNRQQKTFDLTHFPCYWGFCIQTLMPIDKTCAQPNAVTRSVICMSAFFLYLVQSGLTVIAFTSSKLLANWIVIVCVAIMKE